MQIGHIKGTTRVLGKSQGYLGLPIRDQLMTDSVNGPNTPYMVTAWELTPGELQALNAGASIHLYVMGTVHPPVMMLVGTLPGEE